ncbi:Aldose 1-epimerase [Smittium mucronatum]|uniref:Aldose 1-epimerase n=1 Tax=Smittium mucronatum TaxID=133383 RepID=A0A1R0H0J0_9FUNG|nr:Aldose 1-epimerase [Smittium mucronatum]
MSVDVFPISKDGSVHAYKLANKAGSLIVQLSSFGARLSHIWTLDKENNLIDILIGFDSHEDLLKSYQGKLDPYIGALIGRLSGSVYPCDKIELNNTTYSFNVNVPRTGASHHGGIVGIDKHIWTPTIISHDPPAVKFVYISPHMEENYPGTLEISVTYTVTNENDLKLAYLARFLDDGPLNDSITETALSLTNHAYFNLTGFKEKTIDNHTMLLNSRNYLLANMDSMIFNGQISRDYENETTVLGAYDPVKLRAPLMDFVSAPKNIGPDLHNPLLSEKFGGYDHVFTIHDTKLNLQDDDGAANPKSSRDLNQAVKIWSNQSGVCMKVLTDEPAFVFYTGNSLDDGLVGKGGTVYGKHSAFSIETQRYNNAINVPKWRDMVILKRGKLYSNNTIFSFSRI